MKQTMNMLLTFSMGAVLLTGCTAGAGAPWPETLLSSITSIVGSSILSLLLNSLFAA